MCGMSKRERFAECAEDNFVLAGDITSADGVYADSAFLPQSIFSTSAVSKAIGESFARGFADILGQRKSRAAWSVFLEAVVLLDYLYVIFIAEH